VKSTPLIIFNDKFFHKNNNIYVLASCQKDIGFEILHQYRDFIARKRIPFIFCPLGMQRMTILGEPEE